MTREEKKELFSRTERLIGEKALDRLSAARVAVFGIGGVGGYVCEALVRSGIGHFTLVDSDTVSLSNLNRQIIALHSTIGRNKTEVMKERMLDINPDVKVEVRNCFYLPENADEFDFKEYDYVVDAVDTVTAKIEIIMRAKAENVPVISSMGAGNHLDPSSFRAADLYQTSMCPLAKVMRREMKKRGVKSLKVVYSTEEPVRPAAFLYGENVAKRDPAGEETENSFPGNVPMQGSGGEGVKEKAPGKKAVPGSVAFAPSAAGLILASEVVKDLIEDGNRSDG